MKSFHSQIYSSIEKAYIPLDNLKRILQASQENRKIDTQARINR